MEKENREKEVLLCNLAKQAGDFDAVIHSIKKIIEIDANLSQDERNSLSVGYEGMVEVRRARWLTISAIEKKEEEKGETEYLKIIKEYLQKIADELEPICKDCIDIIDTYLLPANKSNDAMIFYNKMKGDFYRYLVEICVGNERKKYIDECFSAYYVSKAIADSCLQVNDPRRIELTIIINVGYYQMRDDSGPLACDLTKFALEEAGNQIQHTLFLQLLKDNLTRWCPVNFQPN